MTPDEYLALPPGEQPMCYPPGASLELVMSPATIAHEKWQRLRGTADEQAAWVEFCNACEAEAT